MAQNIFVKTADGSNTIYNPVIGEHYHSTHGALQESLHVFVNAGFQYFLNTKLLHHNSTKGEAKVSPTGGDPIAIGLEGANISILEVGFGTGLNFLLTADFCAENNISLDYTGIEAYPLDHEMIRQTGYEEYTSPGLWQKFLDNYEKLLLAPLKLTPYCKLQIANCKLEDFKSEKQYDIIYYDAFASARQPEMWDEAAIAHTIQYLKPGGVFVTYAITGNLKRALKVLGCKVEKAPGALGKREMLRAVKV
jgi:tRNA U34 5-methylaminomethyl-2-thiouridine-forming methyltransferase MnmC